MDCESKQCCDWLLKGKLELSYRLWFTREIPDGRFCGLWSDRLSQAERSLWNVLGCGKSLGNLYTDY